MFASNCIKSITKCDNFGWDEALPTWPAQLCRSFYNQLTAMTHFCKLAATAAAVAVAVAAAASCHTPCPQKKLLHAAAARGEPLISLHSSRQYSPCCFHSRSRSRSPCHCLRHFCTLLLQLPLPLRSHFSRPPSLSRSRAPSTCTSSASCKFALSN